MIQILLTLLTSFSFAQCPPVTVVGTQTIARVKYKASCTVLEDKNECSSNLAIRFSGFNMMKGAALGCVMKYDRPGEMVSPTLIGQGIIPYTTFGGGAPQHYSRYDQSVNPYGEGIGCIPCRFESGEAVRGTSLTQSTAPLPFDQDSITKRQPIFTFQKLVAPQSCVRNIDFEVRYFGSSACDGVSNPPGHFCESGNVPIQSCSAGAEGSGNIAARFRIPVCPGSGFESNSVSVSWSPLLLDITGNGFSISREFNESVLFDILGTGKAVHVDWPINTNEVAFLVRPDSRGRVNSIRQLFGDYKAKNGFEALRKLDSNRNGYIDSTDTHFGKLALWFDRNRNGHAESHEIEPLSKYGVDAISLKYNKPLDKGIEGKTLNSTYYHAKNQNFQNIADYYFYQYGPQGNRISGQ